MDDFMIIPKIQQIRPNLGRASTPYAVLSFHQTEYHHPRRARLGSISSA